MYEKLHPPAFTVFFRLYPDGANLNYHVVTYVALRQLSSAARAQWDHVNGWNAHPVTENYVEKLETEFGVGFF